MSLSASYTSTIAEEMVALIRSLHTLDLWNPHINYYISGKLGMVANMVIDKPRTLTVRTAKYTIEIISG